jgi:phage shock protein C
MTTETAGPPAARSTAGVRRLYRSKTNRVFAGVCGGLAEYYGSDPTAVRLAALFIGLFTGIFPMLVVYVIAAIVVPEADGAVAAGDRTSVAPGQTAIVVGAFLVLLGIVGLANVWLQVDWDRIWPFVLIGLGAIMVAAAVRPRSRG